MVHAYNENRYYRRHGRSTRPMTAYEIELDFGQLTQRAATADLRLAQVPLVARVRGNTGQFERLPDDASVWVSTITIPLDAPDRLFASEPDIVTAIGALGAKYLDGPAAFAPSAHGLNGDRISASGHMRYRAHIFENGVIEIGREHPPKAGRPGRPVHPGAAWVDAFRHVRFAAAAYPRLGYFQRVRLILCLNRTEGAYMDTSGSGWYPPTEYLVVADHDLTDHTDTTVDALAGDPATELRPVMDWLWRCFQWERCRLYEGDGKPGTLIRRWIAQYE
jgi:hypothetical protein